MIFIWCNSKLTKLYKRNLRVSRLDIRLHVFSVDYEGIARTGNAICWLLGSALPARTIQCVTATVGYLILGSGSGIVVVTLYETVGWVVCPC